jgi:hypothetical protein
MTTAKNTAPLHVGAKLAFEAVDTFLERHDKSVIGAFTIVLAISTIGLWLATNKLWRAGERQIELAREASSAQSRDMRDSICIAKRAADAADLSAKAATAIEFPVVRTDWMGPELMATDELIRPKAPYGGVVNDGWPTRFCAIGEIEFRNYGRTPAFAVQVSLGFDVAARLSEEPKYTEIVRCEPNTVIGARENRDIEIHFGFELTSDQVRMVEASEAVLWLYGRLTFRDVMDRPHESGFCWQWGRQNEADDISYFFDDGSAPAAYTAKT